MKKLFLVFLICISLISLTSAITRYEFYTAGNNTFGSVFEPNVRSQTFRVGSDGSGSFILTQVALRLSREGVVNTSLIVNITTLGSDGFSLNRNNTISSNATFNGSLISNLSEGTWYNITMPPVYLIKGQNYSIMIYHSLGDSSNRILWRMNSTALYTNNATFSTNSGVTWEIADGAHLFETYGNPPYTINSERYPNVTTGGNNEYFEMNITIPSTASLTSTDLIYNGTVYSGSITAVNSTFYRLSRDLTIPSVATTRLQNFYWNFTLDSIPYSSPVRQVNVTTFSIDDCTANSYLLLNYTLKDEDTQTTLNGTVQNGTIEVSVTLYPIGSTTPLTNYSKSYNVTSNARVCLSNTFSDSSSYQMDAIAKYSATGYSTEYNNIQKMVITNSSLPQNINLLDLLSSRTTSFRITYKDSNFIPVPNVLINVARQYVSQGQFKTVEIGKTDSSGQAVVSLVQSTEVYTFTVTQDGVTLATFENNIPLCQNQLTDECTITLNAFTGSTPIDNFINYNNLNYLASFDKGTRTLSVVFHTVDGSNVNLNLTGYKFDRFGNNTGCSSLLTSSSGTISCQVPASFGNSSIIYYFYSNNRQIFSSVYTLGENPDNYFGGTRFVLIMMLVMTLPLMLFTSTVGMVVGGILGIIIASVLAISSGGSYLGAGSAVGWLIVAGIIIIYKIVKGGEYG